MREVPKLDVGRVGRRILLDRNSWNERVSKMAIKSARIAGFVESVGDEPVFVEVGFHKLVGPLRRLGANVASLCRLNAHH